MRDKTPHHAQNNTLLSVKSYAPEVIDSRAPLSVLMPALARGIDELSPAYQVMRAAVTGDVAALKSALAQPNALPDFANSDGVSPLMVAAARGNDAVVDVLSAHPLVNLARADERGWTALHFAAWYNHAQTAATLLDHHAAPLQKSADGKTAFDLAKGHSAEESFWQNRDFARIMRRAAPPAAEPVEAAPVQAAAPAAAPTAAPQKKTPEKAVISDTFVKAILKIGVDLKANPRLDVLLRITEEMARLDVPQFKLVEKALDDANAHFDWKRVFVEAARRDNTALMCCLHDRHMFQLDVLNPALAAAIEGGDNRNAAHHLLRWRAEPQVALPVKGVRDDAPLHRAAYVLNRHGIFEEIMTFAGQHISDRDIAGYARTATMEAMWISIDKIMKPGSMTAEQINRVRHRATSARAALSALEIQTEKQKVKGMRSNPLREKFNAAVEEGHIARVMAAYVESREDRFFRGVVELDARAGGGAIAVALLHEKYEFARMLMADGHHLKHAPMGLRHKLDDKGTDKAKQFAAAHMDGTLKPHSITAVGRMRPGDVVFYPMYGRGYYGI